MEPRNLSREIRSSQVALGRVASDALDSKSANLPEQDDDAGELRAAPGWLRRMGRHLLTQQTTPLKLSVAVGVGILIGNLPFYGFHLPICIGTAWLFGLNQVTTYLAANISNPPTAPFLAFGAIQVGQRILTGAWLPLSVEELRARGTAELFGSWLLGSLVVGSVLGLFGAFVTHVVVQRWRHRASTSR